MPVEVHDLLHVLAHELRTPVGIAHGYVRLLLDNRLPEENDRRRALEQMQRALSRLSDLSRETTSLAVWYQQPGASVGEVDVEGLLDRVAAAEYAFPIHEERDCEERRLASRVIRCSDGDGLVQALVGIVRATARELRGETCAVHSRLLDDALELRIGSGNRLHDLLDGPHADGAGPVTVERGGLGLTLVQAALVLDAVSARWWTVNGSRQVIGVRLPIHERQQP